LANHLIEKHIDDEIIFACSGKAGKACIEDSLCAGFMIDIIAKELITLPLDDGSLMARNFYETNSENLLHLVANSEHGHFLESLGYEEDLKTCCAINTTKVIPYYDKSKSKIII
jgi:2-phosphosulfolactate phosphatase